MPVKGEKTGQKLVRDSATGRFLPGNKSGGRPPLDKGLTKESFRELGPRALEVLIGIMEKEDASEASRIKAAEIILDRGYGKAVQAVEATVEAKTSDGLSLAEKLAYIKSLQSDGETPTPQK